MRDGCGCMAELVMPNNMLAGAGCWSLSSLFGIIGVGTAACATVAITKIASSDAEIDAKPNTDSRTKPKPPKGDEEEARSAMLNTAKSGKFSSDRTIEEYAKEIWHLDKVKVEVTDAD